MLVQPLDRIFHIIRTNASQVIQALGTQEVRGGRSAVHGEARMHACKLVRWMAACSDARRPVQVGVILLHNLIVQLMQNGAFATCCPAPAGPAGGGCQRAARQPQGRRGHQHHRSGCGLVVLLFWPSKRVRGGSAGLVGPGLPRSSFRLVGRQCIRGMCVCH